MQRQAIRAPVPVVDAERHDDRRAPAEQTGQERGHPATTDAEQAQGDDRDDDCHDGAPEHPRPARSPRSPATRCPAAHRQPPLHGGAPAPHSTRPERRSTSRTSVVARLEAERLVEDEDRRRVGVAVEPEAVRHALAVGHVHPIGAKVGWELQRSLEPAQARLVAGHLRRPLQRAAALRPQRHFEGVPAGLVGVEPEPALAAVGAAHLRRSIRPEVPRCTAPTWPWERSAP